MGFPIDWAASPADSDRDGITDVLEEALAERFAPVIFMTANERNLPCSVPWFLGKAHLRYFENCGSVVPPSGDTVEPVPGVSDPVGTNAALIGPPYRHPDTWRQDDPTHPDHHCGAPPQHAPISTVEPHPMGRGDDPNTDDCQTAFIFDDLSGTDQEGSLFATDWVTYIHVYPSSGSGIVCQYWHVFAYDALAFASAGDHGGDWDATVIVELGPALQPLSVRLSRHSDDHPGALFDWSDMVNHGCVYKDTHPQVVIDGGGHGSFFKPSWDRGGRPHFPVSDDLSGWQDDPDHPTGPCIVWKTWPGQTVVSIPSPLHPPGPSPLGPPKLKSLGPTPPLVNLGEYNPGPLQACALGQQSGDPDLTRIAAGQEWIRYSGTWGHPSSTFGRPPRGPVFQGWDRVTGRYTSWYYEGSNTPAQIATHPWLIAPTVQMHVNPDGTVTLTAATTNSGAGAYGALTTLCHLDGSPWEPFTRPITVPPGRTLTYMAVDAFGNESLIGTAARRLQVTLSGQPADSNGVFPLDSSVTLTVTATDTLTGNAVNGLTVSILKPTGPATGGATSSTPADWDAAGVTGQPFPWTFPSSARYVTEHDMGIPRPNGPMLSLCTSYTGTHYPAARVEDGGAGYGQVNFATGPNDLSFPTNCLSWQANQMDQHGGLSLYGFLNSGGGGDPVDEVTRAFRKANITPTPELQKAAEAYVAARTKTLAGVILVPPAPLFPALGQTVLSTHR